MRSNSIVAVLQHVVGRNARGYDVWHATDYVHRRSNARYHGRYDWKSMLMKKLAVVGLFLALFLGPALALDQALVVSACGTPPTTYTAGQQRLPTVDTSGKLCLSSGGVPPSGAAGGDLSGTYPNPTVAKIQGVTPGTGVSTALGVSVGSAGSFVVNGGSLGTPSSGTLTNATGLPVAGITGFGTGVATALGNTAGGAGGFALVGTTPPTGSAGGDLTGTYPNPTIKASVSLTTPNINVATGTSLALNAAIIGPNVLSVIGPIAGDNTTTMKIGTASNTSGGAYLIARVLTGASDNHGFDDTSTFQNSAGTAYNSFSANGTFIGSNNYGHYSAYQDTITLSTSGTVDYTYGYYTGPNITNGTLTNRFGVYINDISKSGSGVVTTQYGVYINNLASAVTNYAIYSTGSAQAFINGPIVSATYLTAPNAFITSNSGGYYLGASNDTVLTRKAAASWQFGAADAVVAVAQTTRVQSVVAGTAAANGAHWTLIGSLPTGTGTSGDIIIQTGVKTGSGTTQGTATTALTIKGETQAVVTSALDSSTSAGGALQVAGGASVAKRFWIPAITASSGLQTAVLCQSSGGEMIADSVACLASSARFKNIRGSLSSDVVDKFMKLPIKIWAYKPEGIFKEGDWTRDRIGPVAEDVAELDPRLAEYDHDGNVRAYSTEQLLAYTIKVVQEQQGQINKLRARLQ